MRKVLLLISVLLLAVSCSGSLPGKFTRLADKVEAKGMKMTEAQWEKSNAQFEKLIKEYIDNYDSFNSSQKKEINNAIGRYSSAALKSGIGSAAEAVNSILEELPVALNGLLEGVKGFLEGLGL